MRSRQPVTSNNLVTDIEVWKRPAGRTHRTYLVPICGALGPLRIALDQGTLRFYDTVAKELSEQGYKLSMADEVSTST